MKKCVNIRVLAAALSLSAGVATASADLQINEVMQSNIDCIMDDLNEYPDSWVELYNNSSSSVNLADYALSLENDYAEAYKLPAKTLNPGEYVIIYCDKTDHAEYPDALLHTPFRVDSGKGSVYLWKGQEILETLTLKKMPAPNIAYGRQTEADDTWGYQAVHTPGRTNCGRLVKDLLGDVVFSVAGQIYTNPFELTLSTPADAPEATVIRYTLTGEEPTEESAIYTEPIQIEGNILVRAKLFCDGYLSPRAVTNSYIVHPRELTLPVVSIVSDNNFFYDDTVGILVKGAYNTDKPNFEYDWRRPINIEYFDELNSPSSINQLCETRIKGGASRECKLKSMAIYANKRFGTKRFTKEFFPQQTPGIDDFKSFELRNSGNDFYRMYMRDAIIQKSMGMYADLDWQPSQPIILYINGEYKGIANVRPRSNEDYIYSYYDGLEDIDMIENWWELKEGTWDNYNAFTRFYSQEGHSYEEFKEWMDTEEFCNLMALRLFYDDKDFPGNNIVMWRPRAESGKWRWIAKDADGGMGFSRKPASYPTLTWLVTPGFDDNLASWANREQHTRLFRRLIDTPEFREMFIDRCAVYMGDFLTLPAIYSHIDNRYEEISFEHEFHKALNSPYYGDPLKQEVEYTKEWLASRWDFFYEHLASFFGLDAPIPFSIDQEDGMQKVKFTINDVAVTSEKFNGKYFPGRILRVSTVDSDSDKEVKGWEVTMTSGGKELTYIHPEHDFSILLPKVDRLKLRPVYEVVSLDDVYTDTEAHSVLWYDLQGRALGEQKPQTPGVYLRKAGSRVSKVIL